MSKHTEREDLAGEHPFGDTGQLIFFVLYMMVWVADSFIINYSTQWTHFVPVYLRLPLAILILILAFYLVKSSHDIIFKEERKEPAVVREGVYQKVRHPMYLAILLFYTGLFFSTLSLLSLFLIALIFLFYNFIADYEEQLLMGKFGEDYKRYQKDVPRWIPKF